MNNLVKILAISGISILIYKMFSDDKELDGIAHKEGKTKEDFEPAKLKLGAQHEMEHTSQPEAAEQIAMDHLTEDEDYYEKLAAIEKKNPNKKLQSIWFDSSSWTTSEAKNWLKKSKRYKIPEVHVKGTQLRFRQEAPRHFKKGKNNWKTKSFNGVNLVYGTLKKE
jgi:hypothetical protein